MLNTLKSLLIEQGACAVGVAEAEKVEETARRHYLDWIRKGMHGTMTYLENHLEVRFDPRLLLPEARSIVCVAFNYRQPNPLQGIATYALGMDYHHVIRKRLERVTSELRKRFGGEFRICIDSAPLLERYWAVKAGIGTRSPLHGNVSVPGVGSMVFLAEIITTHRFETECYGEPLFQPQDKVIESDNSSRQFPCPTGALGRDGVIDARRCINYLTIENRGEWTAEERALMSRQGACDALFGCDICQLADALNREEFPEIIDEFKPNEKLPLFIERLREEAATGRPATPVDGFSLRRSPLGRAGRKSLIRNLKSR